MTFTRSLNYQDIKLHLKQNTILRKLEKMGLVSTKHHDSEGRQLCLHPDCKAAIVNPNGSIPLPTPSYCSVDCWRHDYFTPYPIKTITETITETQLEDYEQRTKTTGSLYHFTILGQEHESDDFPMITYHTQAIMPLVWDGVIRADWRGGIAMSEKLKLWEERKCERCEDFHAWAHDTEAFNECETEQETWIGELYAETEQEECKAPTLYVYLDPTPVPGHAFMSGPVHRLYPTFDEAYKAWTTDYQGTPPPHVKAEDHLPPY